MIGDTEIKNIAERQNGIVDDLLGKKAGVLSKAAQLSQYRQRTGNTAWVDRALQTAQHPSHRFLLQTIKEHGWGGLMQYLKAMQALDKGREG